MTAPEIAIGLDILDFCGRLKDVEFGCKCVLGLESSTQSLLDEWTGSGSDKTAIFD